MTDRGGAERGRPQRAGWLHTDSARNRLIGIGIVSLAYVDFTLIDGTAKWLVGVVPVFMVVWLRFLVHVLIASALFLPARGLALVRTRHLRWHVLRAFIVMGLTCSNFWTLKYLELAVTTSIFFSAPIMIALVGALLGEKLGAGRWAAIIAGFAGVLVVVRPGSADFHPAMLVTVVNAVAFSAFVLTNRRLAAYDSPETIQFLPAAGAAIGLAPFAIAAWEWPDSGLVWAVLILLGCLGGLGHYLFAVAHRYASATVTAPFMYQQVIYAVIFGYLVFGDVPGASLWVGAAIIIGSGLYLFSRERAGSGEQVTRRA